MKKLTLFALAAMLVATAAFGASSNTADAEQITYSNQVARILQAKCQSCHRPGDIAPMSFMEYSEVRPWAKSIRRVVTERTMPPWHADAPKGTFRNDNSLTDAEIETLSKWVAAGAPKGDPADLPPALDSEGQEWRGGDPDLVYWMPESYTVTADLLDEYRCFVIPTSFEKEFWYRATEYKPGNPEVVHHVIAFADTSGQARQRDAEDPQPGYECGMGSGVGPGTQMLGGWAPGNVPSLMPEGMASKMPEGTDIIYQVHYHNTTGVDQVDQSGMAIYLQRGEIDKAPRTVPIAQWRLDIKAGDPESKHVASWTAPTDIHVRAVMPHMHYIGKSMKLEAKLPDGTEKVLIDVPRYDFNWQTTYLYEEPVAIPEGTVLTMTSIHDNSADNPNLQFDEPQDVHFGEASHEEMAIAWTSFTVDDQELDLQVEYPTELVAKNREQRQQPMTSESSGGR